MKFHKTGSKERQAYTYVGADGRKVTLVPGENGITEEHILMLHRMDDNEVYNNNKNHKAPVQEWEKAGIEEWKRRHPDEELPERWNVTLDMLTDTDDPDCIGDKGAVLQEIAVKEEDVPADVERLREVVELLAEEQRELYRMVVLEGVSLEEAGRVMGLNSNSVKCRMRRIREFIKKSF